MIAGLLHRRALLVGVVVVAAGVLVVALLMATAAPGESRAVPRPAPELAGTTVHGGHASLAELRGRVVLVPVWASWCAPCRAEQPVLTAAQEEYGDDGLVVLGLNVHDRPAHAREFAGPDGPPTFESVLDVDGRRAVDWGLRGVPETFLVDRDGSVVAHRLGEIDPQWVRDVVGPVVREPVTTGAAS